MGFLRGEMQDENAQILNLSAIPPYCDGGFQYPQQESKERVEQLTQEILEEHKGLFKRLARGVKQIEASLQFIQIEIVIAYS